MSEPENFLARWLRVKQESSAAAQPDSAVPAPKPSPAHGTAPFDPASLPPIDSITKESDIRLFLQANVPAELTRAALRAAWLTDPAIRDFIGIAESQWDFNDPSAMPGFGPLKATDNAENLAARFSPLENAAGAMAGRPDFPARPVAKIIDTPRDRHADKVWRSSGMSEANPPSVERDCRVPEDSRVNSRSRGELTAEMAQPVGTRRHGSALPKLP
ncbi:MAG TPA: DUF3306 domain-containing protein [Steroidobacteraceae bacterium]